MISLELAAGSAVLPVDASHLSPHPVGPQPQHAPNLQGPDLPQPPAKLAAALLLPDPPPPPPQLLAGALPALTAQSAQLFSAADFQAPDPPKPPK